MNNAFVVGIISWFLPGYGHLQQGRWKRGVLIALAIWVMFIIGIASGGAFYPGFGFEEGMLLSLLNVFAKLGNGLGMLIALFFGGNAPINAASWATFEYGGRFLEVAGLLNFLAVIDAVDIQSGRKK